MKAEIQGVLDLLRCGTAEVVYSEHYFVVLTLTLTGELATSEEHEGCSMIPSAPERAFARRLVAAAKEIAELKAVVPAGNWADLGGDTGMAEALLKRASARAYLP